MCVAWAYRSNNSVDLQLEVTNSWEIRKKRSFLVFFERMPDSIKLFWFVAHEVRWSDREPWFLMDYIKKYMRIGWKTKKLWWFSDNFVFFQNLEKIEIFEISKIKGKSMKIMIFQNLENFRFSPDFEKFSKFSENHHNFFVFQPILIFFLK